MNGLRAFASAAAVFFGCAAFGHDAAAQTIPSAGQIKSPYSGLCAEISSASTAVGAKAVQQPCSSATQQQWEFRADAGGGHRIVNRNSNLCLGVAGASVVQGTAAEQQACTGDAGQRWTIVASGANVEIRNANSGQCLEIGGASMSPGATLSQWNCAGAAQQTWSLVGSAAPSGLLVNRNSGMCAHIPNASKAQLTALTQWTCSRQAHLLWEFRPAAGGAYQIVNRNSGLCLDVNGGSTADGATAIQYPCGAQTNQLWTMRPKGDSVELVANHSGKCLDVEGGSIDHGGRILQWTCNSGANQQWTALGAPAPSLWTARLPLPIVPVAASVLRNGKILTWSAYDRFAFGGDQGKTFTALFDPATNSASERLVSNTGHDMFCPGTSVLADGRILVTGGSSSSKASIYDPTTNAWTATTRLNVPRGYQGDTLLSTGDVFTVGGSWSGGQGGKVGEVWSRTAGTWRRLTGVSGESMAATDPGGIYRGDNHMWLYGAANGYVFQAGPSQMMHWVNTAGAGAVSNAGLRGDDAYSMNGNVVMYDAGKLLKLGGAPAYEARLANSAAYRIDFSRGPGQPVAVTKQKPMTFPRAFANAVALPTGEVVVMGGQTYPTPFSDARAIMVPEIWSPATGAFTSLAEMAIPRTYHSVAGLMLDGRVFVGGGGLCGSCATNHADIQILTPPYLLNADGSAAARPTISTAPTTGTWGQTITVGASGASAFSLVRLSSTTHSVNNDQRRLPLAIASASGSSFRLQLPADRGTLLPGDWMLFAMNANGTPSVAKILRIQ
ncbi:RICIN domain-containing protein [Chelatococcus sambhunathii]|uniref:RICIN domain-containing protein n=1 Tax=Chelatococcus sambhunathii TaxID=363953 RepID=A0ABU1DE22_9HYPH|nr:RICIN domain-containing protein [Chelatococcus sambhunathii]MDR4306332.1 RICIN domain-containing protein [Chelatococcus sambhunathii]